jgi:hypothetical protein
MKKILFAFLLFSCSIIKAQDFEGVITWKITPEMDAETKAKMDEAQKKMNDPATQAQIKEMKEKMNDPQFKAMMESNPQMKAQIEQMLKMSEGGGDVNSLMPKSMVLKIKDQNVLTKMEGGMMGTFEVLSVKKDNSTYKIDREAKTYTIMSSSAADSIKVSDVKITKTAESAKILNYPCTKYIAESTVQGQPVRQIFWATTAIKGLNIQDLAQHRMGNTQQELFYKKIEGVPLKIEMKQPQFGMTMEVVAIEKQSLPASDFTVPKDFKETRQ